VLTLGGANNYAFANTNIPQRKTGHYYGRVWLQERNVMFTNDWKLVTLERFHIDNRLSEPEAIAMIEETIKVLYRDGKNVVMPGSVKIRLYSAAL